MTSLKIAKVYFCSAGINTILEILILNLDIMILLIYDIIWDTYTVKGDLTEILYTNITYSGKNYCNYRIFGINIISFEVDSYIIL